MPDPRRQLLVMRLAEMFVVHPQMVQRHCCRCNEIVGIYPSGQQYLTEFPDVKIVCSRCNDIPREAWHPAPGALDEIGSGFFVEPGHGRETLMNDLRMYHTTDDGRKFYLVEVGKPFTSNPKEALRFEAMQVEDIYKAFNAYLKKIRMDSITLTVEAFI